MGVITSATWTSGVSCTKIAASKDFAHAPSDTLSVALRGTSRRAWRTTSAIAAGSYPALSEDCGCTATGLIRTGTQWKKRLPGSSKTAQISAISGRSRTH